MEKAAVKRNGMTWVDLWHGVTEPLMLWGAEVGEMKRMNGVKGFGLRYENRS